MEGAPDDLCTVSAPDRASPEKAVFTGSMGPHAILLHFSSRHEKKERKRGKKGGTRGLPCSLRCSLLGFVPVMFPRWFA